MAEANLARSLFSGKATPAARKKAAERTAEPEAEPVETPPEAAIPEPEEEELTLLRAQLASLESFRQQQDALESDLLQCLSQADGWRQQVRSLEQRNHELETQLHDLQELVLQQSSQRSELEAAIHHWKEQSVRHQHHALQLSGALERLLSQLEERRRQEPELRSSPEERNPHLTYPPRLRPREEPLAVVDRPQIELPAFLGRSRYV